MHEQSTLCTEKLNFIDNCHCIVFMYHAPSRAHASVRRTVTYMSKEKLTISNTISFSWQPTLLALNSVFHATSQLRSSGKITKITWTRF